jgi:CDP-diacylglycerol--glycerol-3-phosphate 3-phosphatidyltransferase/cardiolipin synthase
MRCDDTPAVEAKPALRPEPGGRRVRRRFFPSSVSIASMASRPINIPTLLTWARVAAIPLVVGVYFLPAQWLTLPERDVVASVLFILSAITDWLDGYLARRLGQTSAFGAFLDPVADKLMVTAALLVLLQLGRIDALVALIIIGREIAISALREWMAHLGQSRRVAVSYIGKVKTAVQMVAIPLLLFDGMLFGVIDTEQWGTGLIWIAAVLTLWSMLYYFRLALAAEDPP